MLGLPNPWMIGIGVALVVGIAAVSYGSGSDAAKKKCEADKAAAQAAALAKIVNTTVVQGTVTAKAEAAAPIIQERVVTRTQTLVKEVARVVPPDADPIVSAEFVRLLDEAAAGGGDANAFASGLTHESTATVRLSDVGRAYVINLGIGHQNSEQLRGLQQWNREIAVVH